MYSQILKDESFGQFQRAIGGTDGDYTWSIKQTPDSGYAVAGYTNSFGAGASDVYIIKLTGSGSILQWSRTIGGTGNDIALSMIQTTDGGYVVAGETDSYGAGSYDIYIMKLDNNGTLLWSKTFGGAGEDYGESIVQTTDGGFAVAGYNYSFGSGDFDMHILKFDSGGALQWMKTIGGTGYDYALSMTQTTDGGYALFGSTSSFGAGYNDFYIAKLDSSGTLQWSRTIGGTGGDYGSFVIQTADGGYALAGVTISFGAGIYDLYIVKLDSSGLLQWSRTVGGTNFEYAYCIMQTTDGGYAIAGSTLSFGAGGYDAYIVKLDGSGMLQWNRTLGGPFDDEVNSIIQARDGGYVVSGRTQSFGSGGYDMYIVKLDADGNTCGNTSSLAPVTGTGGTLGSPVSTGTYPTPVVTLPAPVSGSGGVVTGICTIIGIYGQQNEIPYEYKLEQNYPNPFNPVTTIKYMLAARNLVTIKIFDLLGKEINTTVNEVKDAGSYEVIFDASYLASGVYFYTIKSGSFTDTKKMLMIK